MTTTQPEYDYIAIAKCGCVVGAIADIEDNDFKKHLAEEIARFVKHGCSVKRISRYSDEFQEALSSLGHHCQPVQLEFF